MYTIRAFAPSPPASEAALAVICSTTRSWGVCASAGRAGWPSFLSRHQPSTRVEVARTTSRDFSGCRPIAVSPVSSSASAFCRTASATSATSARVGVGKVSMLERKWEATRTGLFRCRQSFTICRWTIGTSASGICAPRSPRATITASLASMISASRGRASMDSILPMTPTSFAAAPGWVRRNARSWSSGSALLTKDTATKSTPSFTANSMSRQSFDDRVGSCEFLPRMMRPPRRKVRFARDERIPPSTHSHRASGPATCLTRKLTIPPSTSTVSPACTSSVNPS